MIEYWLQKKTLGGWSHVTWYATEAEALTNYLKASGGDTGYSWRLVKAETIEEKLLEEVTKIEQPKGLNVGDEVKISGGSWANGDWSVKSAVGVDIPSDSFKTHALAGSVWLIHHSLRVKGRFPADKVDAMLAQGYERGGPRTAFKETGTW